MKTDKTIYWVTTILLFMMEGIMPALTFQTEMAQQGISHLGYPVYFGNALVVFKILGALALVIPQVPKRFKELAYAGFLFNFLFASISHFAIDGVHFQSFFPLLILLVLGISFMYYQKLYSLRTITQEVY
ncbi:DoxX family protein [Flavobacterium sp. H122]|uniref:DoxX family protein n=1 Tax=Flavobacterium sp. H122 TaxID=2529860 RepID=UPI0010A9E9E3|nr:DoxX family protein [Flavobacterium sp. H122]